MRRLIVVGGRGMFGSAAVERLKDLGQPPLIAERRAPADIRVDVESAEAIRSAFRAGDIVLDTAGPFPRRTNLLARGAVEVGFDLIDIAASGTHVRGTYELRDEIEEAGIRVLPACSSVSALTAFMVERSGFREPTGVTVFLKPALGAMQSGGTAQALLANLGRTVSLLEDGRIVQKRCWLHSRPVPGTKEAAHLFDTPDPITLPPVWNSLRHVSMYVTTGFSLLNGLFGWAARSGCLRTLLRLGLPIGAWMARWVGSKEGWLRFEVEGEGKQRRVHHLDPGPMGNHVAIAPAVLAATAIQQGNLEETGLIPPNRHVDPTRLQTYLEENGARVG